MKKIIICLLVLCFSCQTEQKEKFYYLDDIEAIDLGLPYNGGVVYLSNRKNVFKKIVVYPQIIDKKETNRFILVQQKPDKKIVKKQLIKGLILVKNNNDSIQISLPHGLSSSQENKRVKRKYREALIAKKDSILVYNKLAEEFIKTNNFYQFLSYENAWWILDKKTLEIYGPLSHDEFQLKKELLGIKL